MGLPKQRRGKGCRKHVILNQKAHRQPVLVRDPMNARMVSRTTFQPFLNSIVIPASNRSEAMPIGEFVSVRVKRGLRKWSVASIEPSWGEARLID